MIGRHIFMMVAACCLNVCLSLSTVQAQKNLITNGDFEDGLNGWNANGPIITSFVVKNGHASGAIITYNKDNWVGMDQSVDIHRKDSIFEFSVWVKTQNVEQGKDPWNAAQMNIQFINAGDKNVGESVSLFNLTGNNEWQLYEKIVKVPRGAAKIKVMLAMSFASGSLFIDDVVCKTDK
jgi:antitoxin component YwqK of YwqJK toxin-antitoxin module